MRLAELLSMISWKFVTCNVQRNIVKQGSIVLHLHYESAGYNKYLNPSPESVAGLRGKFHSGAGLEKRYIYL